MGFPFCKMKNTPPWGNEQIEQQQRDIDKFKKVCRPVVEYIQNKHCPHTQIIIGWASAVLVSEEMGTPFEVPD